MDSWTIKVSKTYQLITLPFELLALNGLLGNRDNIGFLPGLGSRASEYEQLRISLTNWAVCLRSLSKGTQVCRPALRLYPDLDG